MPTPVPVPQNSSVPYDPDGYPATDRTPISSPGTSVAAGSTDEEIMSAPASSDDLPLVQRIQGVCTVAPTATGTATVESKAGAGAILLANIDLISTGHIAGSVIDLSFDTPIRGEAGEAIVITTPANTGTWTWYLSGYVMDGRVI